MSRLKPGEPWYFRLIDWANAVEDYFASDAMAARRIYRRSVRQLRRELSHYEKMASRQRLVHELSGFSRWHSR